MNTEKSKFINNMAMHVRDFKWRFHREWPQYFSTTVGGHSFRIGTNSQGAAFAQIKVSDDDIHGIEDSPELRSLEKLVNEAYVDSVWQNSSMDVEEDKFYAEMNNVFNRIEI